MEWKDEDFVYFDPETKAIIGPVEWTKTGNAKEMLKPENVLPVVEPAKDGKDTKRPFRRGGFRKQAFIWGSYRSLKRLYNLEGKHKAAERTQTLDEAMGKAMTEAYWN